MSFSFLPDNAVSSPSAAGPSASDPFRRLFLDQVENVVGRKPSKESLLALLQISFPRLDGLGTNQGSQSKLRELMKQIHPSQHPLDSARARRLHGAVEAFYLQCMSSKSREKRRRSCSPRGNLPDAFDARTKFPHMRFDDPDVRHDIPEMHWNGHTFVSRPARSTNRARAMAYQCMNARGAIVHGKMIESKFEVSAGEADQSVEQVFQANGGSKTLGGIDEVKEELMTRGPVVSKSFHPSRAFLNSNSLGMNRNSSGDDLLVMISGWKQLSSGEAWIVHSLASEGARSDRSRASEVAVSQFGIDDVCVAPASSFEDVSWQKGPYFDATIAANQDDWWKPSRGRYSMTVEIDSMSDLDSFFRENGRTSFTGAIGGGSGNIYSQGNRSSSILVTVRDKNKKAHSRKATLETVSWEPTRGKFVIELKFAEGGGIRNSYTGPFQSGTNPPGRFSFA